MSGFIFFTDGFPQGWKNNVVFDPIRTLAKTIFIFIGARIPPVCNAIERRHTE